MKTVAIFCGSSSGIRPVYAQAVKELAGELVSRQLGVVYGGAKIGLMGCLAKEMLFLHGKVTGVIVSSLVKKEIAYDGLTELLITHSMHERKQKMYQLADAFIVLPGGFGTLDELFEVATWAQLGFHQKPIGLLDVEEYFSPLLSFLDRAEEEGFIKSEYRDNLIAAPSAKDLTRQMFPSS